MDHEKEAGDGKDAMQSNSSSTDAVEPFVNDFNIRRDLSGPSATCRKQRTALLIPRINETRTNVLGPIGYHSFEKNAVVCCSKIRAGRETMFQTLDAMSHQIKACVKNHEKRPKSYYERKLCGDEKSHQERVVDHSAVQAQTQGPGKRTDAGLCGAKRCRREILIVSAVF